MAGHIRGERVNAPRFQDARAIADRVVRRVLAAADPAGTVRDHWPSELDSAGRVVLLAAGKGSTPMVEAAVGMLGGCGAVDRVVGGAVACVPEHEARLRETLGGLCDRVAVCPADHPLATERNLAAAGALASAAEGADPGETVLALISGGASAHLTLPAGGLTLENVRAVTSDLLRAGATINELNTVRKHLERLKGGGLARLIHPAPARVLVLSDVLGDPLDTIGSGPTAPDPTTYADALAVLGQRGLGGRHPEAVHHLERGAAGEFPETPEPGDAVFGRVSHTVIANNAAAVGAAVAALSEAGFATHETRTGVQGEAADMARELVDSVRTAPRPAAVVFGGETTVTVGEATGVGGRNQELALAAAVLMRELADAAVLTLATDGVDGPTDAAGAVVTSATHAALIDAGVDPASALAGHDSTTALDGVGALVRTGPTGTNINDIAVAMLF